MESLVKEDHSPKKIIDVLVYPDDEVPEMMTGVYRVGLVEITYADNSTSDCKELVDNKDYFSEEEMLRDISERLNVSYEIVRLV